MKFKVTVEFICPNMISEKVIKVEKYDESIPPSWKGMVAVMAAKRRLHRGLKGE